MATKKQVDEFIKKVAPIAQAKAEERRAAAIANAEEMKAEVERMKAKVIEAEAQVPMAISEALRSGNLGIRSF